MDREIAHVWTFRGGRAIRHESFTGREEALEAVGLRESQRVAHPRDV